MNITNEHFYDLSLVSKIPNISKRKFKNFTYVFSEAINTSVSRGIVYCDYEVEHGVNIVVQKIDKNMYVYAIACQNELDENDDLIGISVASTRLHNILNAYLYEDEEYLKTVGKHLISINNCDFFTNCTVDMGVSVYRAIKSEEFQENQWNGESSKIKKMGNAVIPSWFFKTSKDRFIGYKGYNIDLSPFVDDYKVNFEEPIDWDSGHCG